MPIFLYNLIQFFLILFTWPFLPLLLLVKKYRRRLPHRCGFGLADTPAPSTGHAPTVWVHALSVGEVTSAVPLIQGLRHRHPKAHIVVTVTTTTGQELAERLLASLVDRILATPLDLLPVVSRYIQKIRPDLYILVETDFWPNLLAALSRHRIPSVLVNARTSAKSFDAYRRHRWFFRPMFRRFTEICLQTEKEKEKFGHLGVQSHRLHTLGNLKYDRPQTSSGAVEAIAPLLPPDTIKIVAGSTHPGEEELIFAVYHQLRSLHTRLYLLLAPRNPDRTPEILDLAGRYGLTGVRRTTESRTPGDFLVIDTIGELADCYTLGQIAVLCGSIMRIGGHNPIEPARAGIPVLFGHHMEDFRELSAELLKQGGAIQFNNQEELTDTLDRLLTDPGLRDRIGRLARETFLPRQGVVTHHLDLLDRLLSP